MLDEELETVCGGYAEERCLRWGEWGCGSGESGMGLRAGVGRNRVIPLVQRRVRGGEGQWIAMEVTVRRSGLDPGVC